MVPVINPDALFTGGDGFEKLIKAILDFGINQMAYRHVNMHLENYKCSGMGAHAYTYQDHTTRYYKELTQIVLSSSSKVLLI